MTHKTMEMGSKENIKRRLQKIKREDQQKTEEITICQ